MRVSYDKVRQCKGNTTSAAVRDALEVSWSYLGSLVFILTLGCFISGQGDCHSDATGQALPHHDRVLALHHYQSAGNATLLWLDAVQRHIGALRFLPSQCCHWTDPASSMSYDTASVALHVDRLCRQ